jgi:hypothetical protein
MKLHETTRRRFLTNGDGGAAALGQRSPHNLKATIHEFIADVTENSSSS